MYLYVLVHKPREHGNNHANRTNKHCCGMKDTTQFLHTGNRQHSRYLRYIHAGFVLLHVELPYKWSLSCYSNWNKSF